MSSGRSGLSQHASESQTGGGIHRQSKADIVRSHLETVDQSDVHSQTIEFGIIDVLEFIDCAINIRGEEQPSGFAENGPLILGSEPEFDTDQRKESGAVIDIIEVGVLIKVFIKKVIANPGGKPFSILHKLSSCRLMCVNTPYDRCAHTYSFKVQSIQALRMGGTTDYCFGKILMAPTAGGLANPQCSRDADAVFALLADGTGCRMARTTNVYVFDDAGEPGGVRPR